MMRLCADQGIGSIPWSPLARGLLARAWATSTNRSGPDRLIAARFGEAVDRPIVERVAEVAAARTCRWPRVAMAWVMHHPVVSVPIVCATKVHQIVEAVAAFDVELTDEERSRLEEPYHPKPASC